MAGSKKARLSSISEGSSTRVELARLRLEVEKLKALSKSRTEGSRHFQASKSSTEASGSSRSLTSGNRSSPSSTSSAAGDTASFEARQELARMKAELAAKDQRLSYLERHHREATRTRKAEIVRRAQALDLAFLVDATWSMADCIDMVKKEVASLAEGIAEAHPESKLRVAFVSYRDYDDEPYKSCDFTSSFRGDRSVFMTALAEVEASGAGKDVAEDVFSGLEDVANLSWKAANRVLIHIADAPCHGRRFHDGFGDRYLDGDIRGRDIGKLLRTLRDGCKISTYTFCHLNQSTKKMVQEFEKETGGGWIQQEMFENVRNIPQKLVAVSSQTISSTLSGLPRLQQGRPGRYLLETVQAEVPDWSRIFFKKAREFRGKVYRSLDHLLEQLESGKNLEVEAMPTIDLKIAPHPFSGDGAMRWPFFAEVRRGSTRSSPATTFSMVVKSFKVPSTEERSDFDHRERYLEQMEVQTVSAELAAEFNKKIKNLALAGAKQVRFCEMTTLEVTGASDKPCRFDNMEKFLKGSWVKYSNNAGYVNTTDYVATLQAFSHWTHVRSKGFLMVTDLQGVDEFWLCDSAIHCKDVIRFTRTNLGKSGFRLFYKTHQCNDVCRALKLKAATASGWET